MACSNGSRACLLHTKKYRSPIENLFNTIQEGVSGFDAFKAVCRQLQRQHLCRCARHTRQDQGADEVLEPPALEPLTAASSQEKLAAALDLALPCQSQLLKLADASGDGGALAATIAVLPALVKHASTLVLQQQEAKRLEAEKLEDGRKRRRVEYELEDVREMLEDTKRMRQSFEQQEKELREREAELLSLLQGGPELEA